MTSEASGKPTTLRFSLSTTPEPILHNHAEHPALLTLLYSPSRHEATPQIWQETYISSLLRAIRYADDPSYRLAGYRKLDPITTGEGEQRFLEASEALFFKGGCLSLKVMINRARMFGAERRA